LLFKLNEPVKNSSLWSLVPTKLNLHSVFHATSNPYFGDVQQFISIYLFWDLILLFGILFFLCVSTIFCRTLFCLRKLPPALLLTTDLFCSVICCCPIPFVVFLLISFYIVVFLVISIADVVFLLISILMPLHKLSMLYV
jgi:hypothetical protein